jgi:esterase
MDTTTPLLAHSFACARGARPALWMVVLHGVFGKGRNWGSIARRVVEARPEWGAVLVDLRLHGDSPSFEPPHTVGAAAEDVDELVRSLELQPTAVLGHSFGGKVALRYAGQAPPGLRQVWVMDSTPEPKAPAGSAWRMIETVRSLPPEFDSRMQAVRGLEGAGYATPIAQWMAMNLEPDGERFRWKLDFDAVESMLEDFFRVDLWTVVEDPPSGVEVHLVKATESSVLSEEGERRADRADRAEVHRLQGGHWINTDNPDAVVSLLVSRLPGAAPLA